MIISINTAVEVIRQEGVIATPTEAVYGLSVDPNQPEAIQKLLALKQRDPDKGLIIVAADIEQLEPWVDWSPLTSQQYQTVISRWPGPFTWVVPAKQNVSTGVRGSFDTIAVRVTDHPVMRELCRACDHALISTSANISNQNPARSIEQVEQQFGVEFPILVGDLGALNAPTQILDVRTEQRVR